MAELQTNMSQIFSKLNDLKTVFKFGERIVPIIQSLIEFMKDVIPLLEKINSSIADSTRKMPQAKDQIFSVTNATEMATTEILDLVDVISNGLNELETSLQSAEEKQVKKSELRNSILEKASGNSELQNMLKRYFELDVPSDEIAKNIKLVQEQKDDTYKITLSLQVQDITSQQLATVNHLITSVNERLSSLVDNIQKAELSSEGANVIADIPDKLNFDPNAAYTHNSDKQDIVNDIFDDKVQSTQEEIDQLFK